MLKLPRFGLLLVGGLLSQKKCYLSLGALAGLLGFGLGIGFQVIYTDFLFDHIIATVDGAVSRPLCVGLLAVTCALIPMTLAGGLTGGFCYIGGQLCLFLGEFFRRLESRRALIVETATNIPTRREVRSTLPPMEP